MDKPTDDTAAADRARLTTDTLTDAIARLEAIRDGRVTDPTAIRSTLRRVDDCTDTYRSLAGIR